MPLRVGGAVGHYRAVPAGFRLRYQSDTKWVTPEVLVGGGPVVVVVFESGAAAQAARALASGVTVAAAREQWGNVAGTVARQLLDLDLAVPVPEAGDEAVTRGRLAQITVVVPARDAAETLPRLLSSLPAGLAGTIVVDDGSLDATAHVARAAGAVVLRRTADHGPAAARNAGIRAVSSPLVFFVDADAVVAPAALETLAAHFDDPATSMVAPRITALTRENSSGGAAGVLERYEALRSPLDLGVRPGRVRLGGSIPFVPSAALLARTAVIREAGGFDEALQFGEDQDLVWRLVAAGHVVRYEPDAEVRHDHRVRPWAMLRRRVGYLGCAGRLERRHPGSMPAVAAPPGVLAAAVVAATRIGPFHRRRRAGPPAAAVIAAGAVCSDVAAVAAAGVPAGVAARLVARDYLDGARAVLFAVTRPWLPVALVGSLVSRRVRRVTTAALLVRHVLEWRRLKPGLSVGTWVGLRVADDLASAAGLWQGALAARTAAPLAARRRPSAPTVVRL